MNNKLVLKNYAGFGETKHFAFDIYENDKLLIMVFSKETGEYLGEYEKEVEVDYSADDNVVPYILPNGERLDFNFETENWARHEAINNKKIAALLLDLN